MQFLFLLNGMIVKISSFVILHFCSQMPLLLFQFYIFASIVLFIILSELARKLISWL